MKGWKYNTEQDALAAVTQCDTHYGYPKEDCTTTHWCWYNHSELDGFYYIMFDETIEVVLGQSEEFDVTQPNLGL